MPRASRCTPSDTPIHPITPFHPTSARSSVLTLHIVVLVLLILLCGSYITFMLLPFMREATNETRRIAELLSELPQEVGMAGLSLHACMQMV